MRLNEIKPSHLRQMKRGFFDKLDDWLINHDYRLVGKGFFSDVWSRDDSNVVVKLLKNNDRCYLEFVQFIKDNYKKNKHLPRISTPKIVKDSHGFNHSIVFIEKLYPIDRYLDNPERDYIGRIFDFLAFNTAARPPDQMIDLLKKAKVWSPMAEKYITLDFLRTIDYIYTFSKRKGCHMDIKYQNIMRRNDGTLVLTDPIF